MKELSTSDFEEKMSRGLVLLDIYSENCGVCLSVSKKLNDMESRFPNWDFVSVDSVKNPEISGKFLVFTVPTIILLKDGKELNRWSRNFSFSQLADYMNRVQDSLQ